jgi:hypothetical protein
MAKGKFIQWTPDMDARLGKAVDAEIAEELGLQPHAVTYRRQRLGVAPYKYISSGLAVHIDQALAEKIDALEPLLIDRYRDAGLPISRLERSQIVEIAINELLSAARRKKVKSSYQP